MADGGSAKVESVDTLKALKRAMAKFAEAANVALADADSEVTRLILWLQNEQLQHWTSQIRKRQELVARCEEAVRMKKLFVDSAGRRSSAMDEIKALEKAKRLLEEAITKHGNCKMWSRRLEKEMQNYRGNIQRFATTVQNVLPVQSARLEQSVRQIEAYLGLQMPGQASSSTADSGTIAASGAMETAGAGSMVRPANEKTVDPADAADEKSATELSPADDSADKSA